MVMLAASLLVALLVALELTVVAGFQAGHPTCLHAIGDPPPTSDNIVKRPVLFMIGAQKAGTTYLFNLLKQHPMIHPVGPLIHPEGYNNNNNSVMNSSMLQDFEQRMALKEPHIMDGVQLQPERLDQYRDATDQPGWVLDATPSYLDTPAAACRIDRYFSHMRFVVVLRDPVARALSAWAMVQANPIFHNETTRRWFGRRKLVDEVAREVHYLTHTLNCSRSVNGADVRNWGECMRGHVPFHGCWSQFNSVEGCLFGFVWKGLYASQLEFWLSLFPAEYFHIISFFDLKRNPTQALDGVSRFLGLPTAQPWTGTLNQQDQVQKHAYLDAAAKVKLCARRDSRHSIRFLTHVFHRAQLDLAALLHRNGWTAAISAAQEEEYKCDDQTPGSNHTRDHDD